MTPELKKRFEAIRQKVIDEMFEGKRPVLKRLAEVSQNTLEMRCMEEAYNLDRQEWISVAIKEPSFGRIMIWSLLVNEPVVIDYSNKESLKYFKHWQPLPEKPNERSRE